MDPLTDIRFINKHVLIELIMEGLIVAAFPFEESFGKTSDLTIVNYIYAYDTPKIFHHSSTNHPCNIYQIYDTFTAVTKPSSLVRHRHI